MMNPCIKPMWAPVGQTPDFGELSRAVVPHRNRHHKKVSALGAITLAADGAMNVLIDWFPGSYVRAPEAAAFVERLSSDC